MGCGIGGGAAHGNAPGAAGGDEDSVPVRGWDDTDDEEDGAPPEFVPDGPAGATFPEHVHGIHLTVEKNMTG